jgi:MbtH protein
MYRGSRQPARGKRSTVSESAEQERSYRVVLNHEEQYSIWPADQDIPAGWQAEGTSGTKAACLEHIEQVWTDMRPRSLRESMAG